MLHPWLHEARIAWPRRLLTSSRGVPIAAAALSACVVLILWLRACRPLQRLVMHAPLQTALMLAAVFALAVRGPLHSTVVRWRDGWLAAQPVPRAVAPVTLAGLVGAAALLAWSACVAVFVAPGVRKLAAFGLLLAAAVLFTDGLLALRRRPASVRRAGVRAALFPMRLTDDPHMPHLAEWQRRAGIDRWRRSGGARLVGLCLALAPSGVSTASFAALLVGVIAGAWLRDVLDAAHSATGQARTLLQPLAPDAQRFRRAALRYPVFACGCALALALPACATAGTLWPLGLMALIPVAGAPRACVAWSALFAGRRK